MEDDSQPSTSGMNLPQGEKPEGFSNLTDTFSLLKKSEFYEGPEKVFKDKPALVKVSKKSDTKLNSVLVSPKQRGNPLLKFICNVPWEYDDIIPDYVMGRTMCALFLSLRYHNLNPDYIHERLKALGQSYELRVLLVQVDTSDPHHPLKYLTRVCLLANLTLMLAWSPEDAGRIIETYKIYEHKPPDMIMERTESSIRHKLISALTTVRSINKTDANTLLNTFGSLKKIMSASKDALSLCPGLGMQKATRLYNVLHQPFLKSQTLPGQKRPSSNKSGGLEKKLSAYFTPSQKTVEEPSTSSEHQAPSTSSEYQKPSMSSENQKPSLSSENIKSESAGSL